MILDRDWKQKSNICQDIVQQKNFERQIQTYYKVWTNIGPGQTLDREHISAPQKKMIFKW